MRIHRLISLSLSLASSLCAQFYYPDSISYSTPNDFGLQFEDVFFKSADDTQLHGWYIPAKTPKALGTIIHLHGNAQNISSHIGGVAWLADQGFNLFLFDYRGFGQSDGNPNQTGVFMDCVAAIQEIQKMHPEEPHFVVYGQSLGAANAIAVTGERSFPHIIGVIAEAPFYSYTSIAKDKVNSFVDLFVGAVIRNTHSPHLVVDRIAPTPLLIIHGTADQVVHIKHGQALYEKAKQPKAFWEIPNAGHLDIFTVRNAELRGRLVETMLRFIEHNE